MSQDLIDDDNRVQTINASVPPGSRWFFAWADPEGNVRSHSNMDDQVSFLTFLLKSHLEGSHNTQPPRIIPDASRH